MTEQNEFIPYEVAKEIVGNVIEEEHIREENRRILTVYDKSGRELCWFDAKEILDEIKDCGKKGDDLKIAAVEHILHQIPVWAVENGLKKYREEKEKKGE